MDLREPTAQPVREANADQSVPLAQREHAVLKVNVDPSVPLVPRALRVLEDRSV